MIKEKDKRRRGIQKVGYRRCPRLDGVYWGHSPDCPMGRTALSLLSTKSWTTLSSFCFCQHCLFQCRRHCHPNHERLQLIALSTFSIESWTTSSSFVLIVFVIIVFVIICVVIIVVAIIVFVINTWIISKSPQQNGFY